jgi:hypothetical protein
MDIFEIPIQQTNQSVRIENQNPLYKRSDNDPFFRYFNKL